MAEPQPSNIQEGASEAPPPTTGSAEDRKAAAALSSLDAQGDDEAGKKEVDSKAVENAMKNLSVKDGKSEAQKKAVKIEASDVNLLVAELELPKPKATELLRANDGDVLKAISSFVAPAFA
ncbi:hypothetical protein P171DRAFT_419872 [Karstenula rhodostoma CBS 690.94]|uniref:Nascent polypeptide-associated complex subunit alpha-like UBA domain-containing protein n=1 Tax=Karstenula rhodostoma CBS 690.94 TaxID=1392251 RepID=A0A9P4PAE2_9PLEO|nr:hypothetical protein P171DRAFT_419872 [Karstenula rhodostoma CBS 690.94]